MAVFINDRKLQSLANPRYWFSDLAAPARPEDSSLLPETLADFREQRVFPGLAADAYIRAVGITEACTVHAFSCPPLIIVNQGQIAVSGLVIVEEFHCFAAPLDAGVELGIGFNKGSRFQISDSQVEV